MAILFVIAVQRADALAWHGWAAPERTTGAVLVTATGHPIGGKWQRWVDEAMVPTPRADIIFDAHPASVGCLDGCSVGPPFYGSVYRIYANSRDGLYFELGHIFDWHVLTWRERRQLARRWGVSHHRWLDSTRSLAEGNEDGLEIDFAAAYDACAWGQQLGWLASGLAPAIHAGRVTCVLISRDMRRF